MSLFKRSIDIKNPTKVTYSEDDLKKVDVAFMKDFGASKGQKIHSPIRKEIPYAILSQIRDRGFEDILDKELYTFKHLLVIPNPYGASKHTALLLFNTGKPYKVRYTVHGKTGEDASYTGETVVSKKHRVPIFGLYAATTNKLTLELINENGEVEKRRPLTIYVSDPPLDMLNLCKKPKSPENSNIPFLLMSGAGLKPVVYDKYMDIRYLMEIRTSSAGIITLDNGHFLFGEGQFNRINDDGKIYQCMYHECDYLGRVYKSFILDSPMGEIIVPSKDEVYFVTQGNNKGINDSMAVLNLYTGKVVKTITIEDIFGKNFTNTDKATITSMSVSDDSIIITYKKLNTIVCLYKEDYSIKWVIGDNDFKENSELKSKQLKYKGILSDEEINDSTILKKYAPLERNFEKNLFETIEMPYNVLHLESMGEKTLISVFKAKGDVKDGEKHRKYRIGILLVDEETGKYSLINALADYAFTRLASTLYLKDKGTLLSLKGLIPKQIDEDIKARLTEYTFEGDKVNDIPFYHSFSKAAIFNPDISELSEKIGADTEVIFGSAKGPVKVDEKLPLPVDKKLLKRYFSNMRLTSGMLLVFMRKAVKSVYFVGKNTYKQDFNALQKNDSIPEDKRKNYAIYLDNLPEDEYDIYIDLDGDIYKLKDEIRVE